MTQVNLATPLRAERVRSGHFQPAWCTVFIHECPNGHTVRVRANAFRGSKPEPGRGAIMCPQCETKEK